MPTKKFSSQLLSPNQDSIIMSGDNSDSTVIVNFCNQNSFPVNIWLAYTDDNGEYTKGDYLIFNFPISPYVPFQLKGIPIENLHSLIARTDGLNVSVVVYGISD